MGLIPKRIFFFWSGEKMSWLRYMTLKSFRSHNPEWEIDLYICPDNGLKKTWKCHNQQDFFCYKGKDYFELINELNINLLFWDIKDPEGNCWSSRVTPSQKSNFFKWETLYKDGGIYADMDILWTAPIDKYYNQIKNQDISICYCNRFFSIGLLASSPGCDFYGDVWKNGFQCFHKKIYQTAGVMNIYNLFGKRANMSPKKARINGLSILNQSYRKYKINNFPAKTVYPWFWDNLDNYWKLTNETLPKECVGLHWYAGAEISQKFNQVLNEENLSEYKNTVTHWAEKVL